MQEKEVDLRDYIRVIKKRKKTILLLFLVAVIATAVVNFFLPPVYEVTLAMKIGDIIDVDTLEKELIESPIAASQFLKGPQILTKTMEELKLPYTLEEFRKKISIEPVRETENLLQVKVDVNSPDEAVNIANYLGARLLERHEEIKELYESKEAILTKYDEQINQINEELDEIDSSKEGILVGYDDNIKEMNDQLVLMKNEIDTAKEEAVKLEVSLESVSKEVENRMEAPGSLSEGEANILIGRLNDARSRWQSYNGNIAEKQQRYDNLSEKLRGTHLERTGFQRTKEQRYDALMGELRQAQMEKTRLERMNSAKMYNTEVLAAAEEPRVPVSPNKLLNILVAAVVGLIIGLGLAFSLEYFEKTE